MRRFWLTLLFIVSFSSTFAQQLSSKAQISILTVSPGDELYSKFGHSAIRVHDPVLGLDWVFNYGTFDFNTPHFYLNFIKGRLNYMLSVQTFRGFIYVYSHEKRWVDEQVLNLTQSQKQKIYNFLVWNARPENKYYLYDFFFDNCATRVRDVIFKQLGDSIIFHNEQLDISFRDAFNAYMKSDPWILFGENLIVGSVADRKLTSWTAMYLPDFVEKAFDNIKIRKDSTIENIVLEKKCILNFERPTPKEPLINPLTVFSLLAILVLWSSWKEVRRGQRRRWIDFVILFVLGLAGLVIIGLWAFTDHVAAKSNWNVIWAFPLNFIYAFFALKRRLPYWLKLKSGGFIIQYLGLFVAYLVGFVTGFWVIPQKIDPGVMPILIMAASRFWVMKRL